MKQILLLVIIETNFTSCKNRSKYYCLQEQTLILLLVRIEANITACKKKKFNSFIRIEATNTNYKKT
jgi:hypothetical protein